MLFTTQTIVAAVTVLSATLTQGHMIMKTPVPFNKGSLNSSPLDPSGSDFPCKAGPGGRYDAAGADNQFPLGSTQELSFTGSAVHGGGSCQLSITYDNPPTKSSTWKVILSIEGGCPANTAGNLPSDPNGSGASKFKFQVPQGLPEGKAVLAWTWFNKIGNREMYMNCAPVTLGSGAKAKRQTTNGFYSGLPDMFVANIGNGCATKESFDLSFPSPGSVVQKAGSGPMGPPTGSCAASAGPGTPSQPLSPAQSSSSSAPTATPTKGGQFVPGGAAPGGGSTSSSSATAQPTPAQSPAPDAAPAPVAPAPVAPAPVSPPVKSSPAPPAPISTGNLGAGSCDESQFGKSLCNGTSQIGMCDRGGKIVWIQVAQGTVCKDGFMVFPGSSARVKRSARFSREHIRRRHGSSF